jgi:hypothetical protein
MEDGRDTAVGRVRNPPPTVDTLLHDDYDLSKKRNTLTQRGETNKGMGSATQEKARGRDPFPCFLSKASEARPF